MGNREMVGLQLSGPMTSGLWVKLYSTWKGHLRDIEDQGQEYILKQITFKAWIPTNLSLYAHLNGPYLYNT